MSMAVLYARVSSREQEQEGFSIPAQIKAFLIVRLRKTALKSSEELHRCRDPRSNRAHKVRRNAEVP